MSDLQDIAEQVPTHISLVAGQWAHLHDNYRSVAKLRPPLDVAAMQEAAETPM